MRDTGMSLRRWLRFAVVLAAAILLTVLPGTSVQAANGDNYNININGTFEYKKAFALLDEINALRTDTTALAMDESMMQHAMQRAAEAACLYHNDLRPNYSDALEIDSKASQSSILFGKKTAAKAIAALKKKTSVKNAMLNKNYKSVGIGCFTISKYTYWYILYSTKSSESIASHADTLTRTVTVNVTEYMSLLKSGVDGSIADSITLYARNTCEITPIWLDRSSGLSSNVSFPVEVSSFRFSSSNTDVAVVDSKGVVTTIAPGTAVISIVPRVSTGTVSGVSVKVKVKKNQLSAVLTDEDVVYTGSELTPDVKVTKGKKTLTKDTDYSLDYEDNVNPGIGTVTVTGLGTYAGQSVVLTFSILPKKVTIKSLVSEKGQLTAVWKKVKKASGYQIEISTSEDMKDDLITKRFTYKTRTFTATGLKSGTTYYVRVRAYKKSSEGKLYGEWSKVKQIKVS